MAPLASTNGLQREQDACSGDCRRGPLDCRIERLDRRCRRRKLGDQDRSQKDPALTQVNRPHSVARAAADRPHRVRRRNRSERRPDATAGIATPGKLGGPSPASLSFWPRPRLAAAAVAMARRLPRLLHRLARLRRPRARRRPAQRYLRAMAIGPTLANGGIVYYTDANSMRPSTPQSVQWSQPDHAALVRADQRRRALGWDPATQAAGARGGHLLTGEAAGEVEFVRTTFSYAAVKTIGVSAACVRAPAREMPSLFWTRSACSIGFRRLAP